MSLIEMVENSNFDNLYSKPESHVVSKAYSISKKHRGRRHIIAGIKGHVVR
jgi:hypothetical protein